MAVETIHTYCAMCTSRCGVIATIEDNVFTKVTADPDHPNGCICMKGAAAPAATMRLPLQPADRSQARRAREPAAPAHPGWHPNRN